MVWIIYYKIVRTNERRNQNLQIQLPRHYWRVHTQRSQHKQSPHCHLEEKYALAHSGSESASTSTVEMTGGKANFNQTITLPLNMYYEENNQVFQ